MKHSFLKIAVLACALTALGSSAFASDVSLGAALGARTYQGEGTIYSAPQIELNLFIDGENFGCKLFADFSFNKSEGSNMTSYVVNYNTEAASYRESIGIAPYYAFKPSEKVQLLVGPIVALSFVQGTYSDTYPSLSSRDYEVKHNYMIVNLGVFAGTRFAATDSLSVFAELPLTMLLARKSLSYTKDGDDIEDYENSVFGGGGATSYQTYFTPKIGFTYKL